MLVIKNYLLYEEKGERILLRKFIENKITGIGFFLGLLFLGLLLILADFNGTRYYLYGIILIVIGALICILLLPSEIKVIKAKDRFLIEKTTPFWVKKRFEITKKENPEILGVNTLSLRARSYNLRFSYSDGEIKLHHLIKVGEYSDPSLNTLEEIKEIAHFFNIPYKIR